MKNKMAILTLGIIIGLIYLFYGVQGLFVSSNTTPFFQLVFIVCGPLAMLPLMVLGILIFRLSGILLMAFSILSLISVFLSCDVKFALWSIVLVCLPMFVFGFFINRIAAGKLTSHIDEVPRE